MSRIGNFAGTVLSAFKIGRSSVDASGLSAARTHALPDASGTLALESALTGTAAVTLTLIGGVARLVAITSTGIRFADRTNTTDGAADGFITQSYASGATVTYYTRGVMPGLTGYTPGDRKFLALSGLVGDASSVADGEILQGVATAQPSGALAFDVFMSAKLRNT